MMQNPSSGVEVVWGARNAYRAGRYLLGQVLSARYPAKSKPMQELIGAITKQASDEFNDRVADAFTAAGFDDVRRHVKRVGKLRVQRSNGEDMGDIDVLVVARGRRVLLGVEVKDFETARTPFELRNEVDKFIDPDGSAFTHHAERLDFLRQNLARVLGELLIEDEPSSWDVQGMLVTSADLLGTHYLDASRTSDSHRILSLDEVLKRSANQLIVARRRRNPAKADKCASVRP